MRSTTLAVALGLVLVAGLPSSGYAADPVTAPIPGRSHALRAAEPSSVDLWAAHILQATGVDVKLLLGPDGIHHVSIPDQSNGYGGSYATDRGNQWTVSPVGGRVRDMAVGADGHVFLLAERPGVNPNDPRLILVNDIGGSLTSSVVPASYHAAVSTLAIDQTGAVHVAWTDGDWNLSSTMWADGAWGPTGFISGTDIPRADSMSMAFDGDGVPHVLVAGTLEVPSQPPAGCDAWIPACTVDIALSDTPSVTALGSFTTGSLDAITSHTGSIEAVYGTDSSLRHLSNATGQWINETAAIGNILAGTLTDGPNGLVAIYGLGTNDGIRRADLVGSTWVVTPIANDIPGPIASGVVDGDDVPHVAFTASYWQEGGYLPDAWVAAPDEVGPTTRGPYTRPTPGKTVGSSFPITARWSAFDAQSGLAHYQFQQSTSGGAWSTISSSLTSPSSARSLQANTAYQFRVRSTDGAGNVGRFATGPIIHVTGGQQTSPDLTYEGTWRSSSSTSFWGGSARYATTSTAAVSITVPSLRGFGWVSTYGSTRGSVRIYVDGVEVTTVNLHKSTTTYRAIVWSIGWSVAGTHTITLRPATSIRVDLDGFVVITGGNRTPVRRLGGPALFGPG
jgi:hypothetical protein